MAVLFYFVTAFFPLYAQVCQIMPKKLFKKNHVTTCKKTCDILPIPRIERRGYNMKKLLLIGLLTVFRAAFFVGCDDSGSSSTAKDGTVFSKGAGGRTVIDHTSRDAARSHSGPEVRHLSK